jgi:hypothetical protein
MADWQQQLEARGIEVVVDVERDAGARVLREYVVSGGPVYNGRSA